MNKRIAGALIAAVLVLSIGVGASFAASLGNSLSHRQDASAPVMEGSPHQFKQLKLMYSTTDPYGASEAVSWTHVAGNEVSGFKLCLNETVPWYYIDIMALKPYTPVPDGMYPFFVEPSQYPADFKGGLVDGSGDAQMQLLYDIFAAASAPIFYLNVSAGAYHLIDGFQYQLTGEYHTLRVDGTYPLGAYDYPGEVGGQEIAMQITFRACE